MSNRGKYTKTQEGKQKNNNTQNKKNRLQGIGVTVKINLIIHLSKLG